MGRKIKQGQSEITPIKQRDYSIFLSWWFRLAKQALLSKYYYPELIYIDTNAGSGFNHDWDVDGSPVIFCQEAEKRNIPYKAYFIEAHHKYIPELKRRTSEFNCDVYQGNNTKIVPKILDGLPYDINQTCLGLIYMDYNGRPNWDLIENATRHDKAQKIDTLIRYNTRGINRAKKVHGYDLNKDLLRMVKKHHYARDYHAFDTKHWSFLLGMNYPFGEYKKEKWHKLDTIDGKELLLRLALTFAEYQKQSQLKVQYNFLDLK